MRASYLSKVLCSSKLRKFRIDEHKSQPSCLANDIIAKGNNCRGNPLFWDNSKSNTVFYNHKRIKSSLYYKCSIITISLSVTEDNFGPLMSSRVAIRW